MSFNIPAAYELVREHPIKELMSQGYILRHKKTGARVALLSNDDDNKVFYIGFRTPPEDSTGVAHILEHSVLCGSKNFPVKDPFIELAQGSLNTFLNAMTYPDKTVYPVASCNLQDLKNLMHVYLDAVFYPNIHQEEKIFRQEGWHYHLEDQGDELTINGVVYNEMKGAFSSPDDVHDREVFNSLFPDSPYGVESGGDPECIPDLTYEAFKEFHNRYYHPSNSYIFLYGDMDMEERLTWMDENYLSKFERIEIDSMPKRQAPFDARKEVKKEYPITDGQSLEGSAYLSYNTVIGDVLDRELYFAFQILDYALCSAPGAPIKKALTDAGIGTEVYSIFENGILQPYFSIVSKNTDENRRDDFVRIIRDVLTGQVNKGINKKSLLAAINFFEFKYKEADFGGYPKGLMYGLCALDSWLYSDNEPFMHIEIDDTIKSLRSKVDEGYFEGLIKDNILNNNHGSIITIVPKKGLALEREDAFKQKMAKVKAALSKEEIQSIIDETAALAAYQEEDNKKEDLEKIPLLSISDLGKKARGFSIKEDNVDGIKVLSHDYFTRGICYIRFLFDVNKVPQELFKYLPVHKGILGMVDTAHFTYDDLYNEINIRTGGMTGALNVYRKLTEKEAFDVKYEIASKVFFGNIKDAFYLMKEVITGSLFKDKKRLKEILMEAKSQMQAALMGQGHTVALTRAMSGVSGAGAVSEIFSGISSYRLLTEILDNFDAKADEYIEILNSISNCVFRKENLMVDITMGSKDQAAGDAGDVLTQEIKALGQGLFTGELADSKSFEPKLLTNNEAYSSSSMVQYVCRGGDFTKAGLKYTGALKVLKVIMSYDYLWNRVRVKGGAYGCMCGFNRHGSTYFVSYRDPHIRHTLEAYRDAVAYIRDFKADERTLTKFIIGAVSELDSPLTPASLGTRSLSAYLTDVDLDLVQKERDQVLGAGQEDIRALSAHVEAALKDSILCVVGGESKIKDCAELFDSTMELL